MFKYYVNQTCPKFKAFVFLFFSNENFLKINIQKFVTRKIQRERPRCPRNPLIEIRKISSNFLSIGSTKLRV